MLGCQTGVRPADGTLSVGRLGGTESAEQATSPSVGELDGEPCRSLGASPASASPEFVARGHSAGSSPVKMESCLFSFPIPTPKTWTIMVEPIASQTPAPQLQQWRAQSGCWHAGTRPVECTTSTPADGPLPVPREAHHAPTVSARRVRRNRIYLNGTCIDKGVSPRGEDHLGRPSKGRRGEHGRTFTFIADKRMASPGGSLACPAVSLLSAPPPPSPSLSVASAPVGGERPRRARRAQKRFLTFHQLEFDNETLKPYDRSVFVSGHCARPVRRSVGTLRAIASDAQGKGGNRQSLLEAAEMLLELQMHPSSEATGSLEVPLSGAPSP